MRTLKDHIINSNKTNTFSIGFNIAHEESITIAIKKQVINNSMPKIIIRKCNNWITLGAYWSFG